MAKKRSVKVYGQSGYKYRETPTILLIREMRCFFDGRPFFYSVECMLALGMICKK
jgi:hypothetical protein